MAEINHAAPSKGSMAVPASGDYVDLHELAKGWKAAIARAKDPATRYVCAANRLTVEFHYVSCEAI